MLVRIGPAAANNNLRMISSPWGSPPTLWVHDAGATSLGSNRCEIVKEPSTEDIIGPGTPDIFGGYSVMANAGTYTDFRGGYTGQRLLLRAIQNGVILKSSAGLITGTGADLTLDTGQSVTLQHVRGVWVVT